MVWAMVMPNYLWYLVVFGSNGAWYEFFCDVWFIGIFNGVVMVVVVMGGVQKVVTTIMV